MKKTILCALILGKVTLCYSQSLISPLAGFNQHANQSISFSSGETLVETLEQDDKIITQGFQQVILPYSLTTSVDQIDKINDGNDDLNTLLNSSYYLKIEDVNLYNSSGQLIVSKKKLTKLNVNEWLNTHFHEMNLPGGIYFYTISYRTKDKLRWISGQLIKA